MEAENTTLLISDWTKTGLLNSLHKIELATRAQNGLKAAKITSIPEMLIYTPKELTFFRNIGKTSIKIITEYCEYYDIEWEKIGPILKAGFERIQSFTYSDIPGLTETVIYKHFLEFFSEFPRVLGDCMLLDDTLTKGAFIYYRKFRDKLGGTHEKADEFYGVCTFIDSLSDTFRDTKRREFIEAL